MVMGVLSTHKGPSYKKKYLEGCLRREGSLDTSLYALMSAYGRGHYAQACKVTGSTKHVGSCP
eukprot:2250500-Amphidinium_carterae.2